MADRFDIVAAHYWYCVENHEGQNTFLYERLSKISGYYNPSPMHKGYESLSETQKEIYDDLMKKHFPEVTWPREH
tara:strand:+ start:353 stop:577 length:225 start_codon:yes stop_codon:yes gene_type:complete